MQQQKLIDAVKKSILNLPFVFISVNLKTNKKTNFIQTLNTNGGGVIKINFEEKTKFLIRQFIYCDNGRQKFSCH